VTSNSNTNMDQGSISEKSHKLSISSNMPSNDKKSSIAPSDQSKLSSITKHRSIHAKDSSEAGHTSKVNLL
jgi:hypothetical protein